MKSDLIHSIVFSSRCKQVALALALVGTAVSAWAGQQFTYLDLIKRLTDLESLGFPRGSRFPDVSVRSPPFFSNICAPGEMSGLTEGVRR